MFSDIKFVIMVEKSYNAWSKSVTFIVKVITVKLQTRQQGPLQAQIARPSEQVTWDC